jgi:hypothetical protein
MLGIAAAGSMGGHPTGSGGVRWRLIDGGALLPAGSGRLDVNTNTKGHTLALLVLVVLASAVAVLGVVSTEKPATNRFSIRVRGGQRDFSTVDGTLYWERSVGPLERADGSLYYGSCSG